MSTEPSETELLLDRIDEAERLARAVESHLDEVPLPVDEAEVQRIAARLQARMQGHSTGGGAARPVWPVLLGVGLALAAAALLWTRAPRAPSSEAPELPTLELKAEAPPHDPVVLVPAPAHTPLEASIAVQPGSRVLTSPERRETVVVLVQEGAAELAGVTIPAGHFGVQTRTDQGTVVTRFKDGERPPETLEQGVWAETAVHEQLEELRWKALPDTTLDALDALLEDR